MFLFFSNKQKTSGIILYAKGHTAKKKKKKMKCMGENVLKSFFVKAIKRREGRGKIMREK